MRKGVPAVLKPKRGVPLPGHSDGWNKNWRAVATVAGGVEHRARLDHGRRPPLSGLRMPFSCTSARRYDAGRRSDATPAASTAMLCAVHNRPFRMCAANRRSSSALRLPFVPPVFPR